MFGRSLFSFLVVTVHLLMPMGTMHGGALDQQQRRALIIESRASTPSWQERCFWHTDRLIAWRQNRTAAPVVFTLDRQGRYEETVVTIPEAFAVSIGGVAASKEREIAVVGGAGTIDGRAINFVLRISKRGQILTQVRPYVPEAVTFAEDGTIWTIGLLKEDDMERDRAFHVLQRYDRTGKLLSSRTITAKGMPGGDGVTYLRASRDRVGWYTTAGEYFEFALTGLQVGRYDGPNGILPSYNNVWPHMSMVLTDDNDVIVGNSSGPIPTFAILDRETKRWIPLSIGNEPPPRRAVIIGVDGTTVVAKTGNGSLIRFRLE